jgi:CobQ-like glutamine amidotransferase family enzyme
LSGPNLVVAHLFPGLLNFYGDGGNVRALERRARMRGIGIEVRRVRSGERTLPAADLYVIGGGQDLEQVAVAKALGRLGGDLVARVRDGASVLAVCAGYQSLGWSYRTRSGSVLDGPGLFDVVTVAGDRRLVGFALGTLDDRLVTKGCLGRSTVVGFENHAGMTALGRDATPLARLELGAGNNAEDGGEGFVGLPGGHGYGGLRIGTYLHGPLLPRNPHLADLLLAQALASGGEPAVLRPLDDRLEWLAHDSFITRARESTTASGASEGRGRLTRVKALVDRWRQGFAQAGPR